VSSGAKGEEDSGALCNIDQTNPAKVCARCIFWLSDSLSTAECDLATVGGSLGRL